MAQDLSMAERNPSCRCGRILGVVTILNVMNLAFLIGSWWFAAHYIFFGRTIVLNADDGAEAILSVELGSPSLTFYDNKRNSRLDAGLTPTGDPYVDLLDENGVSIVSINTNSKGHRPQIILREPGSGDILWRQPGGSASDGDAQP